jgi:alpha-methylacyl-CoA racemase
MDGSTPAPAAAGPLAGLRVMEFAAIGPVPMAATLLADLGAEVWRVDRPGGSGLGLPLPPVHDVHARSRRSVVLDLKQPAGVQAALALLDRADVLLEGLRPGVMEKLGLGPEVLRARCPALVYGRMTGWGQTGPLAPAVGHDLNYLALSGALHAIGPAGGPPLPPLNLVADYGGGALFLAFGVMAALWERQRSGRGQVVDAAMVDGVAALMGLAHGLHAAGQWRPERGHNLLDGGAPFYACYECADGRWLSVAALETRFFARLAQGLDLPAELVARRDDPATWPALRSAIAAALRTRSRDEWCAHLEGSEACVAPVLSLDEVAAHPHAQARQTYVPVGSMLQPAPAPRFDRTPAAHPRPAPHEGAHTREALTLAGFSADAIDALLAQGAAVQAPAGVPAAG